MSMCINGGDMTNAVTTMALSNVIASNCSATNGAWLVLFSHASSVVIGDGMCGRVATWLNFS